jgi:hypothetical protein
MPQKRQAKEQVPKTYADAVRKSKKPAKSGSDAQPAKSGSDAQPAKSDSDEEPVRNPDHDLLVCIMTSVLPYVSKDVSYGDKKRHWPSYLDRHAEAAIIYDGDPPEGTDFYARVEVNMDRTTVIVLWDFVPPELLVTNNDETMIKVRDPRDSRVRGELHYTRGKCHWFDKEDTALIYTTFNKQSVVKNVRMLLGTLYPHAKRMQPPPDPNWDNAVRKPVSAFLAHD